MSMEEEKKAHVVDPDYDSDFGDDEDEMENEQLETSTVQRILWPMYIIIFIMFLCVASVPFTILYTIGWAAYQAQSLAP